MSCRRIEKKKNKKNKCSSTILGEYKMNKYTNDQIIVRRFPQVLRIGTDSTSVCNVQDPMCAFINKYPGKSLDEKRLALLLTLDVKNLLFLRFLINNIHRDVISDELVQRLINKDVPVLRNKDVQSLNNDNNDVHKYPMDPYVRTLSPFINTAHPDLTRLIATEIIQRSAKIVFNFIVACLNQEQKKNYEISVEIINRALEAAYEKQSKHMKDKCPGSCNNDSKECDANCPHMKHLEETASCCALLDILDVKTLKCRPLTKQELAAKLQVLKQNTQKEQRDNNKLTIGGILQSGKQKYYNELQKMVGKITSDPWESSMLLDEGKHAWRTYDKWIQDRDTRKAMTVNYSFVKDYYIEYVLGARWHIMKRFGSSAEQKKKCENISIWTKPWEKIKCLSRKGRDKILNMLFYILKSPRFMIGVNKIITILRHKLCRWWKRTTRGHSGITIIRPKEKHKRYRLHETKPTRPMLKGPIQQYTYIRDMTPDEQQKYESRSGWEKRDDKDAFWYKYKVIPYMSKDIWEKRNRDGTWTEISEDEVEKYREIVNTERNNFIKDGVTSFYYFIEQLDESGRVKEVWAFLRTFTDDWMMGWLGRMGAAAIDVLPENVKGWIPSVDAITKWVRTLKTAVWTFIVYMARESLENLTFTIEMKDGYVGLFRALMGINGFCAPDVYLSDRDSKKRDDAFFKLIGNDSIETYVAQMILGRSIEEISYLSYANGVIEMKPVEALFNWLTGKTAQVLKSTNTTIGKNTASAVNAVQDVANLTGKVVGTGISLMTFDAIQHRRMIFEEALEFKIKNLTEEDKNKLKDKYTKKHTESWAFRLAYPWLPKK